MFETLHAPALYLALAPVLALYASGRQNGTILDSGYGVSHAVPIYDGFAIPKNIICLNPCWRVPYKLEYILVLPIHIRRKLRSHESRKGEIFVTSHVRIFFKTCHTVRLRSTFAEKAKKRMGFSNSSASC